MMLSMNTSKFRQNVARKQESIESLFDLIHS